tara:strand:- start:579 stop:1460 length:882 start_codon:yes stop_codon:yes gene_type:complete
VSRSPGPSQPTHSQRLRRPTPLKVDFGFFVTLRLAGQGFWRSLPRVLTWSLLSTISAGVICALPILLGLANYYRNTQGGETSTAGLVGGSVALLAMLLWWVGSGFVLAPAGGVVLVDQELREDEAGWSEALGRAMVAVLNQAGSLVVIFTIYLALVTLIVLPGLVGCYAVFKVSGDNRLLAAVFLAGEVGIGLTFLIATLGLAIPVCLLEEAGPGEALGRSWQLSTLGLGSMAGLAGVYVTASLLFTILLEAIGLGWLFEVGASFVFSLFLPALLVAAYQGLAAEDAEVLGRK